MEANISDLPLTYPREASSSDATAYPFRLSSQLRLRSGINRLSGVLFVTL